MPEEPDKPVGSPEGGGAEDAEKERPTVSPPFDPIAFAKEILGGKPSSTEIPAMSPPPDIKTSTSPDAHTHATPPQGTEAQALAMEQSRRSGLSSALGGTLDATAPPAEPPRRKTPTSALSLINARIPSNLPPRPSDSSSSHSSSSDDDKGRTGPATAPPTSGLSTIDDPVSSRSGGGPQKLESLSSMNAVDREWADLEIATRPPPADGPGEDPVIEIMQDRPPQLDLDDIDLVDPAHAAAGEEEHGAPTVRRPIPDELIHPPPSTGTMSEREMNDRVSLGDYSGALEIAEKILEAAPNNAVARACAESCRTVLRQMYATRIGPLDRVPIVMVPRDQLRWLSIDHKAGFVLSLVDGVSSLEMIIDVSGMPELDTLRILSELAQQRIISLR